MAFWFGGLHSMHLVCKRNEQLHNFSKFEEGSAPSTSKKRSACYLRMVTGVDLIQ